MRTINKQSQTVYINKRLSPIIPFLERTVFLFALWLNFLTSQTVKIRHPFNLEFSFREVYKPLIADYDFLSRIETILFNLSSEKVVRKCNQ